MLQIGGLQACTHIELDVRTSDVCGTARHSRTLGVAVVRTHELFWVLVVFPECASYLAVRFRTPYSSRP